MPYIVKVPKNPRLEEEFQYHLKKIGEGDDFVLYQGVNGVIVPLRTSWSEAVKLVRKIKVEGAFKRLPRIIEKDGRDVPAAEPLLVIVPKRSRILTIRLSDEEYELLKEDAYSVGRSVSGWARELVMSLVNEYLAREKFKAALREVEEVCRGCVYWRDATCMNLDIPPDYRRSVLMGKKRICEFKIARENR